MIYYTQKHSLMVFQEQNQLNLVTYDRLQYEQITLTKYVRLNNAISKMLYDIAL